MWYDLKANEMCKTPPPPPPLTLLQLAVAAKEAELLEHGRGERENEIIVTMTSLKAAVSKKHKSSPLSGGWPGWLAATGPTFLPDMVLCHFLGTGSNIYPLCQGTTNTDADNNINANTDADNADISRWILSEWPKDKHKCEDIISHWNSINTVFNLIFIKIDIFSYQVKAIINSTWTLLS